MKHPHNFFHHKLETQRGAMVSSNNTSSAKVDDHIINSSSSSPSPSRKRKFQLDDQDQDQLINSKKMISFLSTPPLHDPDNNISPLDWQRCLDIKSGQIYFYNTKTKERTTTRSLEPPNSSHTHMSLDLELNLPCGSNNVSIENLGGGSAQSPSWVNFEGDDDKEEMVTTVCKKCHMLVMMFKSSPSCPNCKFVYPPHESPPNIFNRTLSLLC